MVATERMYHAPLLRICLPHISHHRCYLAASTINPISVGEESTSDNQHQAKPSLTHPEMISSVAPFSRNFTTSSAHDLSALHRTACMEIYKALAILEQDGQTTAIVLGALGATPV